MTIKVKVINFTFFLFSQRKTLKVDPMAIKAMDQDVGINAPVKYTIQGGILPFLTLNPETAEVAITRPLYEHELLSPATIVVKANILAIQIV